MSPKTKSSYITKSFSETQKLGEKSARKIIKERMSGKGVFSKGAAIFGLQGELGSGKTTFAQGFARGLGIKEKILSPTFIIMKKFQLRADSRRPANFYHIDCYRIKKSKEILSLGFQDIVFNPQNIVIIEWVEKIKKILPQKTIRINFEFINEKTRKITIQ